MNSSTQNRDIDDMDGEMEILIINMVICEMLLLASLFIMRFRLDALQIKLSADHILIRVD